MGHGSWALPTHHTRLRAFARRLPRIRSPLHVRTHTHAHPLPHPPPPQASA